MKPPPEVRLPLATSGMGTDKYWHSDPNTEVEFASTVSVLDSGCGTLIFTPCELQCSLKGNSSKASELKEGEGKGKINKFND